MNLMSNSMNRGRFREIDWGQAPADVKIKLDID